MLIIRLNDDITNGGQDHAGHLFPEGSTAREQEDKAKRRALNMIEALAAGGSFAPHPSASVQTPEPGEVLTLKTLVDLYEEHGLHGRSEG